jgi:hypothetical protein
MSKDEIIVEIAKKYFNVETLEKRKMDRLDFHEVSVWSMKSALEAAYKAGQEQANKNSK